MVCREWVYICISVKIPCQRLRIIFMEYIKMRTQFEFPQIEAFEIEVVDVITTSFGGWGEFGPAWEKDELGPGN